MKYHILVTNEDAPGDPTYFERTVYSDSPLSTVLEDIAIDMRAETWNNDVMSAPERMLRRVIAQMLISEVYQLNATDELTEVWIYI